MTIERTPVRCSSRETQLDLKNAELLFVWARDHTRGVLGLLKEWKRNEAKQAIREAMVLVSSIQGKCLDTGVFLRGQELMKDLQNLMNTIENSTEK